MLNFISYKHSFQRNYFKPLSTASLTSSTLKDNSGYHCYAYRSRKKAERACDKINTKVFNKAMRKMKMREEKQ